ncbi:MAG: DUF3089 domain-containing protein [Novosphingobium sp.]|nr:DUF3089 domain-containing protein [Novosphingobium sp.]
MARKFLYLVAIVIVLVIAALFALRIWSVELTRIAFVPQTEFTAQPALSDSAYADPDMWFARPGMASADPTRWLPKYAEEGQAHMPAPAKEPAKAAQPFAVFFVHPTSYMGTAAWNAPLTDADSQDRALQFLHIMASPFADSGNIWAPRYRQAAFGAFLTDAPAAQDALNSAYGDVAQAFQRFLAEVPEGQPIVLAGHSQGALHVMHLLRDKVADTPLAKRIAAAYVIGWPVSLEHDLQELGLPPCTRAEQSGCVMSWMSFGEPADSRMMLEAWRKAPGLDGLPHGKGAILCTNPLTGMKGGSAPAAANPGTLVPNDTMTGGELYAAMVPARCGKDGLLLIGEAPEMGRFVLPGNNYHVYDVPLFWSALRADVTRRVTSWEAAR